MKRIFGACVLLSVLSIEAMATSLKCETDAKLTYEVQAPAKFDEAYDLFLQKCSVQIRDGQICYTGTRFDIVLLLESFSDSNLWGGEEDIINVTSAGRSAIQYEVWDGPGEASLGVQTIYKCQ